MLRIRAGSMWRRGSGQRRDGGSIYGNTSRGARQWKTLLFVVKAGEYGGAERHTLELVRRLAGRRVQALIVCLGTDFYTARLSEEQTGYVNVSCKREPQSFWEWFRLFRGIKPDAVVLVRGWLWSYRWYTPVAASLAGIPRRFTIAHLVPPPAPAKADGRSLRSLMRRFRRCGHLLTVRVSAACQNVTICVSNTIRDSLIRDYRFPAKKTITICNGVSLTEFERDEGSGLALRNRLGLSSKEFLLVCIARLSEQKGVDILLLAMARVMRDGVRCRCIILGEGPLRRELLEQARALGLSDWVIFEGFQEDVRPYLQAGSALVLTSHREGLPLGILEAMACGLPCIVTDVGGNAEAVTHGVHGLVVPAGSAEEVADAISYLITHPRECAEMARNARARVCEAFDIEGRMAEIRHVILS